MMVDFNVFNFITIGVIFVIWYMLYRYGRNVIKGRAAANA